MKIPFRQGLISFYKSGSTPLFLMPSATAGFIDFNVSPDPTVVTFAHGGSNYVQIFDRDVSAAWGPISGECYIYWEIDLLTALVQYKITALAPVYGAVAPVSPVFDQHWFDLSDTTMKVWTGTKWASKVAVFAGHVHNAALTSIDAYPRGSQVGLASGAEGGYIMVDTLQRPVRAVNFEFLTTSTPVYIRTTSSTSGVLAIPPNAFVPVRASQTIPAFSLVYFTGADTVGLASSDPSLLSARTPIGIVQMPLQPNDLGVLTQSGEIQWDQWDWSAHLGAPLYCDAGGQVTTARPNSLLVYRIGFVKNKQTILFQIDAETMPQIFQANANDVIVNGVAPITTSFGTNLIGERVWSVSAPIASAVGPGFMPASAVTNLVVLNSDVATLQTDVAARALIAHTQPISTIIGLQDALDAKSFVGHNHDLLYLPIGYTGFDTRYAPFSHTQEISTINGLPEAITALMTSLQNAVDTLQIAINGKADRVHGHVIADITGLQPALDTLTLAVSTKVDATYIWPMSSVTGLASALGSKAPISHTHIIADVTGLQAALDALTTAISGKANLVHTHVAADVIDFTAAVDVRLARPLNQVVIGSGTGMVTSSYFQYDPTTGALAVNYRADLDVQAVVAAPSPVIIKGADAAAGSVQAGADVRINSGGTDATSSSPSGDVNIYVGDGGGVAGNIFITSGTAGQNSFTTSGGCVVISGGPANLSAVSPASGGAVIISSGSITPASYAGGLGGIILRSHVPHSEDPGRSVVVNSRGALGFGPAPADNSTDGSLALITTADYGAAGYFLKSGGRLGQPSWVSPTTIKPTPMTVATLDNITLDFGGASDHGLCARFTSAADVVVTVRADTFWTGTDEYWANNSVPLNQGPMPDGGSAIFGKHGAGKITFVADPGVTLNYPDSLTVSRLNAKVTLIKVGPNEWDLDGHFDLA